MILTRSSELPVAQYIELRALALITISPSSYLLQWTWSEVERAWAPVMLDAFGWIVESLDAVYLGHLPPHGERDETLGNIEESVYQ